MLEKLELDNNILEKLLNNNIKTINDLWLLKRADLRKMDLTNNEINNIIIKFQLNGMDLGKKIYSKD